LILFWFNCITCFVVSLFKSVQNVNSPEEDQDWNMLWNKSWKNQKCSIYWWIFLQHLQLNETFVSILANEIRINLKRNFNVNKFGGLSKVLAIKCLVNEIFFVITTMFDKWGTYFGVDTCSNWKQVCPFLEKSVIFLVTTCSNYFFACKNWRNFILFFFDEKNGKIS